MRAAKLIIPIGVMISAFAAWSAQAPTNSLEALLHPSASSPMLQATSREKITLVRETMLRDVATVLGAQAGLVDRSKEIFTILDARQTDLDKRYQFNRLVLNNNVLPPVISESRDVVALDATAMRVAGVVYRIDEPARFALPTPTWRDWLYLGLDVAPFRQQQIDAQVLPQNQDEQEFWERTIRQSYETGRSQAQATFDANIALLDRTYSGMRRFYELVQRGMVTSPIIATATAIAEREDPNTISVGNTIFRITSKTDFTQPERWIPLE